MKKVLKAVALILVAVAVLAAVLTCALIIYSHRTLNFDGDEQLFERSLKWESTAFYASADPYGAYAPIKIETAGTLEKQYFPLEQMSPYLIDGFVAVEDRGFWEHNGVDLKRTLAAAVNYVFRTKKLFGGSTITQQVVKNISGDSGLTLTRKLSEILRAGNLERNYSKEEIMAVYLNVIPMSENIYGVGRASLSYFGKEPSELSVAEAATLIGITNAPTAYNPYTNPEKCLEKRNLVLSVMHREGVISEDEYKSATSEPLELLPRERDRGGYSSWFVETVIDDASADLAEQLGLSVGAARMLLLGGGYSVYTTMDTELQAILEEYFENEDNFPEQIRDGLNYSMVVCDSATNELRAIVGRVGKKEGNRLLNYATVPHTPGSVLKPLALYAPLIDEGQISWSTVFDDVPTDFYGSDGEYRPYPRNSPDIYDGLTTVADSVRLSKNTVAVRLYKMRGARSTFDTLRDGFGFSTLVESRVNGNGGTLTDLSVAPLALGQLTDGVSLRTLTESFGVFSADGELHTGRSYVRIIDSDENTVIEKQSESKILFSPSTARIMNKLLQGVTDSGTAARVTLKSLVDTAGKTGTSGGSLDKLFIGYTPYLSAGIWCGYGDGDRAVGTLSKSHIAIWDEIMTEMHRARGFADKGKSFSTDGLLYRPFCKRSGELYCDKCLYDPEGSTLAYGWFAPGNMPSRLCDRHILCEYDTVTKSVANADCPREDIARVSLLLISDRAFPTEIFVTDAEFAYRETALPHSTDGEHPFFYYALPEGEYAGISRRKRQFNAGCEHQREN